MTYLIERPTEVNNSVEQPTNCSNCPQFKDYEDERGRGWCLLFDCVSFKHHCFTRDCKLQRVAEEDLKRPPYTEGDKVKIIDSTKDHTYWTTCIVVAKRFNPYRYRTDETWLKEVDWYFLLAGIEGFKVHPQWIAENDICHYRKSHIINPEGEF